jgi:hypothetical protein
MQRRHPIVVVLLGVSGTVSACNSTDMLYSQGPWGPAQVRRSYPEYAAPWGRQTVIVTQDAIEGPAILYPDGAVEALGVQPRRYEVFAEVDMPPAAGFHVPKGPADPLLDPPAIATPSPLPASPPVLADGQAAAPAQASPPGMFTSPKRASSYAGSWDATIGSSRCKVQLSSVPSLDLYKASTQGCSQDAMRGVNGWSFRDDQVVLFSRGQPVARLSGAEASLSGSLSNSSAAITMTR